MIGEIYGLSTGQLTIFPSIDCQHSQIRILFTFFDFLFCLNEMIFFCFSFRIFVFNLSWVLSMGKSATNWNFNVYVNDEKPNNMREKKRKIKGKEETDTRCINIRWKDTTQACSETWHSEYIPLSLFMFIYSILPVCDCVYTVLVYALLRQEQKWIMELFKCTKGDWRQRMQLVSVFSFNFFYSQAKLLLLIRLNYPNRVYCVLV